MSSNSRMEISSKVWMEGMEDISWLPRKEGDDEEALQWAALEKLPTYNRLKRGLLADEGGEASKEIDIKHLSFQEKKQVLNRLVNIPAEDNERFLTKLRERIERVGIEIPTVEVRYQDLDIKAKAHVGSRASPSVLNSVINGVEALLNILHILPSREKPISILHDISGIIKPGRMTLLLGSPGSGKTTLLLALAGRLGKDLKVSGKVTYNGHEMDEFVPQRTSAYISQTDLHIPEMTVRETLAFSARCQGVGTNYDMLVELLRREKEANIKPDMDVDIYMKAASIKGQEASIVTEYILKILGLEHCADTIVGNAMRRGISGGEKKRLTTGEMLVGQVKAFFMDEISTGLDTTTTFQIIKAIKQSIHILRGTAVVSLLQPTPETYDLFDDIILLSEGHIVYQGPCENVLEFFECMGFRCPKRKGVADFLQEVTSRKEQQQYWIHNDHEETYKFVSVRDFAKAFKSVDVGQKLNQELAVSFNKARSHPASLVARSYGLNKKELLKACTAREILLMRRNSFVYIFKAVDLGVSALIVMTLFFRTQMPKQTVSDGGMFMGVLFFTIMRMVFNGYAEMSMTVMELPVFFKQRDLLFFPAWAYSLPKWILKIPISIIQPAIWVSLTYYEIGFGSDIGRLFQQYFLLVWLQQMATSLFRFIAGLGRRITVASTFGSCVTLAMTALGGFVLSRENVKSWLMWGYWISPMMYAQNAIVVNEFLGRSWSHVPPNSTESLGVLVLKSRGIFPEAYWYWLGVGALFGFCLLFNFLFTLALTYLNPLGKPKAILPRESSKDEVDRNHKSTKLSLSQRHSFEREDTVKGHASSRSCSPSKDQANLNRKRGLVLPFQPYTITFDEIRYAVDMPERMKVQGVVGDQLELLKGISGVFRPGVLTALMGVTGAGKTTLMDVLAGRKTGGYIDGTIKISGYPKKQETFARISGYVEQADIHSPHLTVYESLLFSAWLRLPPETASETSKMFVEEIMELVELTAIRDALVGLPGVDGLSTEQRKRLTISVELVANPSIIFMDEPTSGLDARAAAIVMRAVKNTVNTGRTVVCTIHQPSIDIFDAFDELLLVKRGGEEIYFGPLGKHACHLINYFEGIKGVAKIMDGYNPASWMLEISSAAQESKTGVDFAETYKKSELYRRTKNMIEEFSIQSPGSKDLSFPTKYSQSFITQCHSCLWKQHWSYWRNTQYNTARLIFSGLSALILGLIFWDLGSKSEREQDLFNAMGSMYAAVLFLGIRNASAIQPIFDVERTVFYRERAAGMYSALPYAFSQVVIEMPYAFFQTIIYGIIIYAMMGFEQTAAKFFWYIYFTYLTLLSYTYYGMMVIALSPNVHISSIISTSFYSIWNLFSGFIVPQTRMPIWWRWYYWGSPTAWTLYGLVVSQYGDIKHPLNNGKIVEQFIRSHFGFRHDFLGVVATLMIIFPLVFAFIFAFSIRSFNFQRR